jgi:hypothetical protein
MAVKYAYPKKGGPVAYTEGGPPSGVSQTIKVPNDYSHDYTTTQDGKVISTAHSVLSKDGKTITRTVKGTDAQGTLSTVSRSTTGKSWLGVRREVGYAGQPGCGSSRLP